MSKRGAFVLLASEQMGPLDDLRDLLKSLSIGTWIAHSCEELARLSEQTHPEIIFTETRLCDGTWRDVVKIAEHASRPTNVVVVGRCHGAKFDLDAMEQGAFDIILAPFESETATHIVKVVIEDVHQRRQVQQMQAVV